MENQCLQDEGVDSSPHRMRAFVWDFEGSQRVTRVPNGVCDSGQLRRELGEPFGNLQSPTQMLSYDRLNSNSSYFIL